MAGARLIKWTLRIWCNHLGGYMSDTSEKILALADGIRTSEEIAKVVGCSARYARKVANRADAKRPKPGAKRGSANPAWIGGRSVDNDGYVTIVAPEGHPHARRTGRIAEHRHVMEQTLGRYLLPSEVVDHIDGLTLHNAPCNLRVFASNADHLRATITGFSRKWSPEGLKNIGTRTDRGLTCQPVDSYRQRALAGEIRVHAILLAALSLGIDSPFVSGTLHHLEKAQIDYSSRSNLRRALDRLYRKWGWDPAP